MRSWANLGEMARRGLPGAAPFLAPTVFSRRCGVDTYPEAGDDMPDGICLTNYPGLAIVPFGERSTGQRAKGAERWIIGS